MEHNQTPFFVTENENGIVSIDAEDSRSFYIAIMGYDDMRADEKARAKLNAEFICKACNNYQRLIETIKSLRDWEAEDNFGEAVFSANLLLKELNEKS